MNLVLPSVLLARFLKHSMRTPKQTLQRAMKVSERKTLVKVSGYDAQGGILDIYNCSSGYDSAKLPPESEQMDKTCLTVSFHDQ